MIEQTYFLDMIPGESTPPVVHVSQFDVNSRTLTFNLMKGGVAFVPDAGMSVTLDGMKPDNHVFSYPMTVNGSSVSIDVLTQMTVVSGHVRCEVSVSNQNGKIGSANFILAVEESPIDSGSISESDIPIFEDLKNQAQQAAADAEQSASDAEGFAEDAETAATSVSAMMATVESTSIASKAYSEGDYLVLNSQLYEVIADIDSGETLVVGTNISATTVGEELTALNNGLSQKVSSVNGETPDTNGNVQIDATHIDTSSGVAIKTISGNPVTIADALQGKALGVNTTLEPIQDLHGYDHPWVGGASGNLLAATPYGGSYANAVGGDLKINAPMDYSFSSDMIKVLVNVTQNWRGRLFATKQLSAGDYYCSAWILTTTSGNGNARVSIYVTDADLVVQSVVANQSYNGTQAARVVTVTEGQRIAVFVGSTQIDTVSVDTFQVNAGSTPTAYFPFENICPISGRTQVEIISKDSEDVEHASVTVNLGQTVYGGTLNVTTGELTVETANIASYNGETIGEPWWSSMDEYVAGTTPTTGAQVVYTLATPTTVSLTPAQINLLTGTNIISTNADDLSVRYYATGQTGNVEGNLSFLLDKTASNETAVNTVSESIAPTETGVATQNYATGSYVMLNNRLCKVTAAIATGEQIIVGSNVQYTTVADELKAILAQLSA